MRRKKVWRFYCEHCKKSGCSGGHISRHERGCTRNADRACGVCRVFELQSKPLPELIAFCKTKAAAGDSIDGNPDDSSLWLDEVDVKALRELADQCPACMLAALRQSDTYAGSQHYGFKEEMKSLWNEKNQAETAREHGYG